MSVMASQITGLTIVYSTGDFPAQGASKAEIVSIWWRHHVQCFKHPIKYGSVLVSYRCLLENYRATHNCDLKSRNAMLSRHVTFHIILIPV